MPVRLEPAASPVSSQALYHWAPSSWKSTAWTGSTVSLWKYDPTLVDLTSSSLFYIQMWKFIHIIIHSGWSLVWIFMKLTLKEGAPRDQVWDLLCVQLASYLERGPLMWMMPLHLHVNQKPDYDDDDGGVTSMTTSPQIISKKVDRWKTICWPSVCL